MSWLEFNHPATPSPAGSQALRKKSQGVQVHGSVEKARDSIKAEAGKDANCCWKGHPRRGICLWGTSTWTLEGSWKQDGGVERLHRLWRRNEVWASGCEELLGKAPGRNRLQAVKYVHSSLWLKTWKNVCEWENERRWWQWPSSWLPCVFF